MNSPAPPKTIWFAVPKCIWSDYRPYSELQQNMLAPFQAQTGASYSQLHGGSAPKACNVAHLLTSQGVGKVCLLRAPSVVIAFSSGAERLLFAVTPSQFGPTSCTAGSRECF